LCQACAEVLTPAQESHLFAARKWLTIITRAPFTDKNGILGLRFATERKKGRVPAYAALRPRHLETAFAANAINSQQL
jgi:hypothetical protein